MGKVEEQELIIQQLANHLEEARSCMAEISVSLDVSNLGQCKWRLMRCADGLAGAMRNLLPASGAPGGPPA